MSPIPKSLEQRFWSHVDRRSDDECWPWTGSRDRAGYGFFRDKHNRAHRASWAIANAAPIPPDKMVCHTCDNPPCVNPKHLWLGSRSDNVRDSVAKRRHAGFGEIGQPPRRPRGESHGCAKLKLSDAIAIYQSDERPAEIAHRYGVAKTTVERIKSGRQWSAALRAALSDGQKG